MKTLKTLSRRTRRNDNDKDISLKLLVGGLGVRIMTIIIISIMTILIMMIPTVIMIIMTMLMLMITIIQMIINIIEKDARELELSKAATEAQADVTLY